METGNVSVIFSGDMDTLDLSGYQIKALKQLKSWIQI